VHNGLIGGLLAQVERGEIDPYSALRRVLADRQFLAAVLGEQVRTDQ